MLQSMTGFGQAEAMFQDLRIVWRLKSVNHRYLDLALRLPEGMEALEATAAAMLKGLFSRGHIDGYLSLGAGAASETPLDLNTSLLHDLLALEQRLLEHVGTRGVMEMGTLMTWPGMIRERRVDVTSKARDEGFVPAVMEVLGRAAQTLKAVREEEGRGTGAVLMQLLNELRGYAAEVGQRIPEVRLLVQNRLRSRLEDWLTTRVDENRFMQELAVQYNRMDLSEELDRLLMHCGEVVKVIERGEPMGRRLDFLCQELAREANTLCSKSQDGTLSRLGVEMKVNIEKMREQVQNLE
ncbi:MAG: YicC family protein [Magnetococcales bacterium]|nr:YicC family protein [Magnetococcales bacterium]MBF0150449.1 YicC family protein [Magnetococcales bacterium]MBF0347484.1 YicC family protein [Magnetococcales bacterium]MBF0630049.1 YicC family protein [Magnetococcales bacterium]